MTTRIHVADAMPQRLGQTLLLATAGTLGLALLSKVSIPLGPVPVTLQVLGVLLLGGILGPRLAALAVLEYLFLGLCGVPVFAGWLAGPAVFLGPTGGYIAGFLPAAVLYGLIARRTHGAAYPIRLAGALVAGLVAVAVIYLCGWAWLAGPLHLGATRAFLVGILPFVLMDALKVVFAASTLAIPGKGRA